jgi:hypothetical protein
MVVCISIGYFTLSATWSFSRSDSLSFSSPLCPLLSATHLLLKNTPFLLVYLGMSQCVLHP